MAAPRLDPDEALAGPLYLVAALLVFFPALDFVMSIGAPQPGNIQWRFASVGLLSSYLLTPILGIGMAFVIAAVTGSAVVQRLLVVLSFLGTLLMVVLTIGFLLDVVQLRVSIPADGQRAFRNASMRAIGKNVLCGVALFVLGWRARRMIPERSREPRSKTVRIVTK